MNIEINDLPEPIRKHMSAWLNQARNGEPLHFSENGQSFIVLVKESEQPKNQKETFDPVFDYNLERMKKMVEEQEFVEVPTNINGLADFDKWLKDINEETA